MTTATTNLRSTIAINSFVEATDELASLKRREKELNAEIKRLAREVLNQIGDRREVRIQKQIRILSRIVVESVGRNCTDSEIVEFCRQHGLEFQERSAEYLHPSTFTKYVNQALIPEEFVKRESTVQISVI